MTSEEKFHTLKEFVQPTWGKRLNNIPKFKIPLVLKLTPIHRWNIDGGTKFKISVKRDDMNGSVISGNKGRILEFLLADARSKNYSAVIASGPLNSNLCRCVVAGAKAIGMDCHLLQTDPYENHSKIERPSTGNNQLYVEMNKTPVMRIPWKEYSEDVVKSESKILAENILKDSGKKAYCLPIGGVSALGIYGYISAWDELMKQNVMNDFDDIVVTCGTGGTVLGLAIGNYLTGQNLRIHGFCVSLNAARLHKRFNSILAQIGLAEIYSENIVQLHDESLGKGYAKYTKETIEFCKNIMRTSGVCCDPVYTGKALQSLLRIMQDKPTEFKGHRILFIHTGGVFGLGLPNRVD